MASYEQEQRISEFKGLMQYGDCINNDPRYAFAAQNCETTGGVLQPAAACTLLPATLEQPIGTLAMLHRRWYSGEDDKDVFVAASGGRLYRALPTDEEWTPLRMPVGIEAFQSDKWSYVTYERSVAIGEDPIDVLLISNGKDGMFCIYGNDWHIEKVNTCVAKSDISLPYADEDEKKFGKIALYNERIFALEVDNEPDNVYYSSSFDPFDWYIPSTDEMALPESPYSPEDCPGYISKPSWDGDEFTGVADFGSQLVCFKRERVYRLYGVYPGEFAWKEQYGGGAPYPGTIAVQSDRIYLMTSRGAAVFDGMAVNPYQQDYARNVWERMNLGAMDKASGCFFHGKYYCAIPMEDSTVNNAVVIYDSHEGTWLLRTDVSVETFKPTEKELYFTSTSTPGQVWKWEENSWETGKPVRKLVRWVSPWFDFRSPNVTKGGFDVYLTVDTLTQPVTLDVCIQTEKKIKRKSYTFKHETKQEKGTKTKRLHFGGNGRRFRLILESPEENAAWRIVGGVQIISEVDPD